MNQSEELKKRISLNEKLSPADKKEILKSFKSWSGGFTPDEMGQDDWETFIKLTLSTKFNGEEVLNWFESEFS